MVVISVVVLALYSVPTRFPAVSTFSFAGFFRIVQLSLTPIFLLL